MQDPSVCKLPEPETLFNAFWGTAIACMVDTGSSEMFVAVTVKKPGNKLLLPAITPNLKKKKN